MIYVSNFKQIYFVPFASLKGTERIYHTIFGTLSKPVDARAVTASGSEAGRRRAAAKREIELQNFQTCKREILSFGIFRSKYFGWLKNFSKCTQFKIPLLRGSPRAAYSVFAPDGNSLLPEFVAQMRTCEMQCMRNRRLRENSVGSARSERGDEIMHKMWKQIFLTTEPDALHATRF